MSSAVLSAAGAARPRSAAKAGGWANERGVLVLAGLFAVLVALRGLTLLFDHSLHSIDGAMQTWFALDGFSQGQQLGEEFQSYLGITMIVSLLPIFFALGQTLFASTFAAYTMVIAGAFVSAYAIAWLLRFVPRSQRWIVAILLLFVFYYALRLSAQAVYFPYPATFDPGVSLRPLRGFLPFFVLPAFVWAVRSIRTKGTVSPAIGLGLIAGAGLLWSNDAGIPLVIASSLGLGVAMIQRPVLLSKALIAFAAGVSAGAFSLLMLVTHGDPSGWFAYNFRDVAGDQFWYFAPWDRSSRILSPADLPNLFLQGSFLSTISLLLLIASVLFVAIKRLAGRGSPVRGGAFVFVGSAVIGTALIPQLGGHIGAEYNSITFVLGICAPLIVFEKSLFRLAKPTLRAAPTRLPPSAATFAAIAMVAVDAGGLVLASAKTERTVYAEKLGFFVTPTVAEELAAMERLSAYWDARGLPKDARLLSVYTSALDIAADTQSPEAVGSLIHALGPDNRDSFSAQVAERKVAAVTTIAPDYSGWEGWNLRANWAFFEALMANYQPIARTDQHVLWVPSDGLPAASEVQCQITTLADSSYDVRISAQRSGVASLRIERQGGFATGRTALLTVTENSPQTRAASEPAWSDFPRYGIANEASIALGAPIVAGQPTTLTLNVMDSSKIGSARCSAKVMPSVDTARLPSLPQGIDRIIAGAQS